MDSTGDAPHSGVLRKWLRELSARAVELHLDLVSTAYNTHLDGRVRLQVSSNAAGHYSAPPYSLRAAAATVRARYRVGIGGAGASSRNARFSCWKTENRPWLVRSNAETRRIR
jgi:hypothetical protein